MVKEGRILREYLSFLLLFKVSGVRSSFDKILVLPHSETTPEATRINLEISGELKGLSSLYLVPVRSYWNLKVGGSYHHSYNNLINNRIQVGEAYRVIPLVNMF